VSGLKRLWRSDKPSQSAGQSDERVTGNEPTDQHHAAWPALCHGISCLEWVRPKCVQLSWGKCVGTWTEFAEIVTGKCCWTKLSTASVQHCWDGRDRRRPKHWEKNLSLSPQNWMGSNPGLHGERSVTTALAMALSPPPPLSLSSSEGGTRFVYRTKSTAGQRTGPTFISMTEQRSVAHRLPTCYRHYLMSCCKREQEKRDTCTKQHVLNTVLLLMVFKIMNPVEPSGFHMYHQV
jgi:hypothetical protein